MKNFKKILILVIPIISYSIFYNFNTSEKKVIKVPPIVIESHNRQENRVETIANIILNLKKAVDKNKKSQKINKKEEAKEILKILKKSIYRPHNLSFQKSSPKTKKIITSIPNSRVKKKITKKSSNKTKKHLKVKKTKTEKISKVKITKKLIKSKHIKKKFTKKRDKKPSSLSSTEPIGFVKTLGVVGKPKVYEANDLVIDKREEIANDGVVYIPTATTDKLLKELPFVKSIEVVKVTQPFEASEAKKYQLDKR